MHRRSLILLAVMLLCAAGASILPVHAGTAPAAGNYANGVAICGCGKVFAPDASTEYIETGGKRYACCTHACHEMAAKDPAAAAKMGSEVYARTLAQLSHLRLGVGNVVGVSENGTEALCGCGKRFSIDRTTEYLESNGVAYACCSHACHELGAKDPDASAALFEKQLAMMK